MALTDGAGIDLLVGIRTASTWGTAIDVDNAAGVRFRPLSFTFNNSVEELPDESYNQHPARRQTTDTGRVIVTGSFSWNCKYEGDGLIYALFFGQDSVTGTGPYVHALSPGDTYALRDMAGKFATMAWYDGITTCGVDSLKITALEWEHVAGGRLTCTADWVGRKLLNGGTNDLSGTPSALAEDSTINHVMFANSTADYQIAPQGGTLADIELNRYRVRLEREYDTGDIAYTTTDAPYMREPKAGRFMTSGEIQIPYTATTYAAAVESGTMYELKLNTSGGADKKVEIQLPSLKFTNANRSPENQFAIPHTLEFVGDYASTAPSWTSPLMSSLKITNNDSGAYIS